ncbi:choline transporter-like protein 1 [Anopheles ziemanni]|uniref:choline transporter-like protein 1 n=1 Tax=Anopheles coustani TaxID=139045 RepID=UPI0026596C7E|nr:choline transporter-like protein 1 [Anopheles coustani]XP_058168868.1 choline transporter-like protein 1 [Anopheles ziemanni]
MQHFCCCMGSRTDKVSPGESFDHSKSPSPRSGESSNIFQTERHCTDILFIAIKAAFILILLVLIIYCMAFGDIYRIINGYDDCANVCGRDNRPDQSLPCKGADRTDEKFLLVEEAGGTESALHRMCVASCEEVEGFKPFLNRCVRKNNPTEEVATRTGLRNFFQEVSEDLEGCYREMLWLAAIAFLLSLLTLLLLRVLPGLIVWLVLAAVMVACTAGTLWLWFKWRYESEQLSASAGDSARMRMNNWLYYAIAATVATLIVLLVILVMRKRIKLVVQLFKEAGKAIASMPFLLAEPVLTFVTIAAGIVLYVYFTVWIESAGMLVVESNNSAKYVKDSTMLFTRWYNLLAFLWFSQFVIGCQHMVIAGAVAGWFFTRNKATLGHPIARSYGNLVRYHLGTVAFGSFVIALVQFLRTLLKLLMHSVRNPQNRVTSFLFDCCQCCLQCFERFLQYLTRNAYILTAMHGDPFCRAGRNAFRLLTSNALRVFAINSVGDFVLVLAKVFVVVATVLIGMELIQQKQGMHHPYVPLILVGIFAYLVAHCFMTVYEMTVDTIFLCFCEDCESNDGISRPYFMSRGLMEFVQNSKKALAVDSRTATTNQALRDGKAWTAANNKPTTADTIHQQHQRATAISETVD